MAGDNAGQLYDDAAGELDRAAGHYREAARHTDLGEHVKAAHHAHIARGHFLNAQSVAHETARLHAAQFSQEVMDAHPVTEAAAPPEAG